MTKPYSAQDLIISSYNNNQIFSIILHSSVSATGILFAFRAAAAHGVESFGNIPKSPVQFASCGPCQLLQHLPSGSGDRLLQETLPNAVIRHVVKPWLFASYLGKRSFSCAGRPLRPLRFAWRFRSADVARISLLQSTGTAGDRNQHFGVRFAPRANDTLEVVEVTSGASGEFQLLPQWYILSSFS